MNFIKLTYFKPEKKFGANAGDTGKVFYCAVEQITRITPYSTSTKISIVGEEDVEVSELLPELAVALSKARPLIEYGRKTTL